jgi:hypothetical protein
MLLLSFSLSKLIVIPQYSAQFDVLQFLATNSIAVIRLKSVDGSIIFVTKNAINVHQLAGKMGKLNY